MSVRFIIGRAGSGKTSHCLEAVRARLSQNPVDGPQLILLVPEQASLQVEQAILDDKIVPVAHRAAVLSFRRLAFRVLQDVAGSSAQALSDTARVMALTHLARKLSPQLRYYQKVDRLAGFCGQVSQVIKEFIQDGVTPDQLGEMVIAAGNGTPEQALKIHDLQLLYRAYLDYLGDRLIDPSQYLELARRGFSQCTWLYGAHVWVDGFASLSGQEMKTLVDLAKLATHVDIALLADPCHTTVPDDRVRSEIGARLFDRTLTTKQDLERALVRAGVEIEPPVPLCPKTPPRYARNVALAQIERRLFATVSQHDVSTSCEATEVELVELPSRSLEAEYAASRIGEWVQRDQNPLRYRDIAVIVRDLEAYHDLIAAPLTARGIPYFVDRRRSLAHHPLVMLLSGSAQLVIDDFSFDSVRTVLKTGLLALTEAEADTLENHLLAHGVAGRDGWLNDHGNPPSPHRESKHSNTNSPYTQSTLEELQRGRAAFLSAMAPWFSWPTGTATKTGAEWAAYLRHWLVELKIEAQLLQWSEEASGDGDEDQASEHRQIWRDVQRFFDELAVVFEREPLTIHDLAAALEQALGSLTLGIAPPMIDQVLVGAIDRSRHPEVKAVLLLGLNDGVFPKPGMEDPILNDDDRALFEKAGVPSRSTARDRTLEEAMLAYVAFTRASESLVVTYATSEESGGSLRPSPYVRHLTRSLPSLCLDTIQDPIRHRQSWDIGSTNDLVGRLTMEFSTRPSVVSDDPTSRRFWNELYDALRGDLGNDPSCRSAFRALQGPPAASINEQSAAKLHPDTLHTSVSRLETQATCPFKYFANYDLKLRDREQAALQVTDLGTLYHAALEDFYGTLAAKGQSLAQLTDAAINQQLRQSWKKVAAQSLKPGVVTSAKDSFTLQRALSALVRVVRAQKNLAEAGTQKPLACELSFGIDKPGGLPALALTTPKGRRVALRGYIDRVDLADSGSELFGVVVDYKRTRSKRLSLSEVYHGLSLQLLSYLLALEAHGHLLTGRPIKPLAGLYVSLLPTYKSIEHPSAHDTTHAPDLGLGKPRGVVQTDNIALLDRSLQVGWSDFYTVFLKKGGEVGYVNQSDAVTQSELDALLQHTKDKIAALADDVFDGYIAVQPYRLGTTSPCTWCTFADLCRFEPGTSDIRFLDGLKRSEVLQRLTDAP